jgi:hypothetical protein
MPMEEKDEVRLKTDVDEIMKRVETILEKIKSLDPSLVKKMKEKTE